MLSFLLLLAASARASTSLVVDRPTIVPIHHEAVKVLGWTRECSAAVSILGYPFLGDAMVEDPVKARLGTYTIGPGEESAKVEWRHSSTGALSWDPFKAAESEQSLKKAGYAPSGWHESVRADATAAGQEALLSTAAFSTKAPDIPNAPWRLAEVHYSPGVPACGLLIYKDASRDQPFFELRLIRIENPAARRDRARAHVANGLLLFERGDRVGALAETTLAAKLAPDYALARYHHASQLVFDGKTVKALDELEAAIKLDASLKTKAYGDKNFADMAWMPRFQDITR